MTMLPTQELWVDLTKNSANSNKQRGLICIFKVSQNFPSRGATREILGKL